MRKIIKLEETTDIAERTYRIVFEDLSEFEFTLILDGDEYVLETCGDEDRGVRLCQAELESILEIVKKLNERLKRR